MLNLDLKPVSRSLVNQIITSTYVFRDKVFPIPCVPRRVRVRRERPREIEGVADAVVVDVGEGDLVVQLVLAEALHRLKVGVEPGHHRQPLAKQVL